MSSGERRVLARALLLLTVAGVGRMAADARRPPAALLDHLGDRSAELDSASALLAAEEEARSRPLASGERLDPNRASEVELDRLPGVGPALAARIVADRERGGGFAAVADLDRVAGIGPATLRRLAPHLEVRGREPPRPVGARGSSPSREGGARVDLNRADSAALLRVPGIGPALAGRILELRRRRGRITDVDVLLEVKGIGEKTLERLRGHLRTGPGV